MKTRRVLFWDAAVCERCGRCARVCPFGALKIEKETLYWKGTACHTACSACALACPREALSLEEAACSGCRGCSGNCGGCTQREHCGGQHET